MPTVLNETAQQFTVRPDSGGPPVVIARTPQTEAALANAPRETISFAPVADAEAPPLDLRLRGIEAISQFGQQAQPVAAQRRSADTSDVIADQLIRPIRDESDEERQRVVDSVTGRLQNLGQRAESDRQESVSLLAQSRRKALEAERQTTEATREFQRQTEEISLLEPIRQAQLESRREEIASELRQAQQESTSEINDLLLQVQQSKIDPNRIFRSPDGEISFARQIGAAIAVGLGAAGAALAGGRNSALDIMNAAIDRDIRAQQSEADKLRGLAAARQNLWQLTRQKFKDDLDHVDAMRIAGMEDAKIQVQRASQRLTSQQQIANAQNMVAQLTQQQAQLRFQMTDRAQARELQRIQTEAQAAPRGTGVDPANDVPGLIQIGGASKKSSEEARKFSASFGNARAALSEIIQLRERFGAEVVNRPVVRRMKTLGNEATLALKEMANLGAALTESEKELIQSGVLDDPSQLGFVLPEIISMQRNLDDKARRKFRALGFQREEDAFGITNIRAR